jgi:hypothetical protein
MADDDQFDSGVGSVFAAIASERKVEPAKPAAQPSRSRKSAPTPAPAPSPSEQAAVVQPVTRTGRYPGKRNGPPKQKKVTARIPAELWNAYVNWSFEERCSVSELMERGLTEFYQRNKALIDKGKP